MREYELVLVVSPEAGEEGFPATVERVHNQITERGGEIKNVDQWGRRRLAYPVDRFTEGYYNITQFTLGPQDVREIENTLDLAEDVLRHLVVRLEEPIQIRPEVEPEAPAETPPAPAAETPAETPVDTPEEPVAETPSEEPAGAPEETVTETPAETPEEPPAEAPPEEPAEAPSEEPAEKTVEAAAEN